MTEHELNKYHMLKAENKLLVKHNKELMSEVQHLKTLSRVYILQCNEYKKRLTDNGNWKARMKASDKRISIQMKELLELKNKIDKLLKG